MSNINAGWSVESVEVECFTSDSEGWEVIITYRHEGGRWVQESYQLTLHGEVLVDGDTFGHEPFLSDVDENYSDMLDEHGDTCAVERRYFFAPHSETRNAGVMWGDEEGDDWTGPVESDQCIAPDDLDTYDGPAWLIDLDHAVTVHLEGWGRLHGDATLRLTDLDDMHRLVM